MKKVIFLFIAIIFLFPACRSVKLPTVPAVVVAKDSTVEKEVLKPVVIPADSSQIIALMECDSNNRVILKELSELKTKRNASNIQFKPGRTAVLNYKTVTVHDTVFTKEKAKLIYKEKPVPYPVVKVSHELLWWQKLFLWLGVAFSVLIVLSIYNYIKKRWK